MAKDTVNTPTDPNHYKQHGIETWDALERDLSAEAYRGFLVGNVRKYLDRYPYKNGVEDLDKAINYLQHLRAYEDKQAHVDDFHTDKITTETIGWHTTNTTNVNFDTTELQETLEKELSELKKQALHERILSDLSMDSIVTI